MALGAPRLRLEQSWHALLAQWHDATAVWDDPVRWQFDGESFKPLQQEVPLTILAMERLGQVLDQAQQNVH